MQKEDSISTPPLWLSLIPVVVTGITLAYSVFVLDTKPHFSLFLGGVTAGLCAYFHGVPWATIKEGFKLAIARTIPSLIILLIIGMLIAMWIASGIVPAMMYLGLNFMVAQWFLPMILLFCSAMALITGSSWSTVGTIGVAAIGISEGLGIPVAMTAGAVVSGAFFGDKISPMSDSTNLTPSVLGVNLFDHIKHMLYSTVPAIPSLIAGVVLGGIAYLVLQNGTPGELSNIIHGGVSMNTGSAQMDELFSRGGMESMYDVVILALVSLAFGGIMNYTGMLHSMVLKLSRLLQSAGNLTATVISTSILVNIFSANQYLAVILPGQMYEECYRDQRLKLKNLTRTLEAGGTLTAPLVPWNSSGVFVFLTMQVSVIQYLPYALLCWITPIVVILYGYLNITMERTPTEEPEDQQ